jgi:hypothetical protein
VELNPLELNRLCDQLWKAADILTGSNPLSVLDPDFRPWPKIKLERPEVVQQHDRLETDLAATRELLLSRQQATDSGQCGVALKEVLALFGEGIQGPLKRTMGDFLESTNGKKAESKLKDWEREKCSKALATNNAAERPLAVMKELLHSFPSVRLCFLSAISHARVNGACVSARHLRRQVT